MTRYDRHGSADEAAQMPAQRSTSGDLSKFGVGQVATLAQMLNRGDPLADALVIELRTTGKHGKEQLMAGLKNGLNKLQNPAPALKAFLEDVERTPQWLNPQTLRRPPVAYLSIQPWWFDLAMAASVLHTYSSPAIARVLVRTGRLTTVVARRLDDTSTWMNMLMQPGALLRGEPGYIAVVQVRLLHARVRAKSLAHGWDTNEFGVPINQVDMARTWLNFSYVPFMVLTRMGFDFTESELQHMYKLWSYIGYLLGIDPALYQRVETIEQAQDLLHLFDATNGPPDDNSRLLVKALMSACTDFFKLPIMIGRADDLGRALVWHIYGPEFAKSLNVRRSRLQVLLSPVVKQNQRERRKQRAVPAAWNRMIDKSLVRLPQRRSLFATAR